jgi:hypothetical protein
MWHPSLRPSLVWSRTSTPVTRPGDYGGEGLEHLSLPVALWQDPQAQRPECGPQRLSTWGLLPAPYFLGRRDLLQDGTPVLPF